MRLFVSLLLLLGFSAGLRADDRPRAATADEIALFKDAMKNSAQDTEHWAYTETTTMQASKGKARGENIVRFDPSKPYAEQFAPLQLDGKPPTEKQLKDYRKKGEKRGEKVARLAAAAKDPLNPGAIPPPKVRVGDSSASLDLEHPLVVDVAPDLITYEVPLTSARKDIPVEKLQIEIIVNRQTRFIEHASLRIREAFRMKLIAKIKAGEAEADFAVVDPKFGPVITSMSGDFAVSLLFIPVNGTFKNVRTEWRRVKSFDERLQVRLAPMQFLEN